jgi:hypothetical protein
MFLEQRRLTITEEQRRQIIACTDMATVERWLSHALSAASVAEILA